MKKNQKTAASTQRTVKRLVEQSMIATHEQSQRVLPYIKQSTDKDAMSRNAQQNEFHRLYLVKKLSCERSQCYISREVYEKISRFVPVIAPNLSITNYIDSVLRHHLNSHKELINDLYRQNLKMPF